MPRRCSMFCFYHVRGPVGHRTTFLTMPFSSMVLCVNGGTITLSNAVSREVPIKGHNDLVGVGLDVSWLAASV
uniref:Uncharacterized protein n=1 Tax=Arundo donax TaxID=35708 RepID=A0A0A9C344_ARUDO